jgi:hypothetical protein
LTRTEPAGPAPERRVLLDESVPHDLLLHLGEFDVVTVQTLGWAGMKNGALLCAAREAGIQILITADRRIEYQQNIPKSGVALVVLEARSTRMADILPLVPALVAALRSAARRGRHSRCRITNAEPDERFSEARRARILSDSLAG